ncbi:gem (nuclear organelle) associated protein 2 [Mactra antiquata]
MDSDAESFDDDSLGVQAFHVESDDDDFDLNVPPTTGNEYLRRVRLEADECPKVVVANIDVNSLNKKQTIHVKQWIRDLVSAPKGFAPSLQWQNTQISNFAEHRQKLARYKARRKSLKVTKLPTVPHANDIEGWCKLCFGRLKPPARQGAPIEDQAFTIKDNNADGHETILEKLNDFSTFPVEGILPLVSVMVAMDQKTVIKVLEYHLNWFEATGFTERQGYWFYALLICLDKPLLPDACSLLRGLARACSRLRASLENIEDTRLAPLNLFICLISCYFDQSDLKDDIT